jgi:uncharacterized membrane protein
VWRLQTSHTFTNLKYRHNDRRYTVNTPIKNRSRNVGKLALAASAAALFATALATPAFADEAKDSSQVKCMGINGCKGQSKCKTASNACAGQNSCKGMGWLLAPSADACMEQGGKVIK